jgi:segregation and condensation protein A
VIADPADAGFRVRLAVFEGPLDLLLTLVQRQSLDITTLALAQVTDQFLAYLRALEEIDAGALAAFCETAATLIVIKSRTLLPRPPAVGADEELAGDELAERLRTYRRLRAAAEQLGRREREGLRAYVRVAPPPELPPLVAPAEASPDELAAAFRAALAEARREAEAAPAGPGVRPHPVRLADRLVAIRDLLVARGRLTFREALAGGASWEYIVVSFLAVLELLRRRVVAAVQPDLFGEIALEARPGLADVSLPASGETFVDAPDE